MTPPAPIGYGGCSKPCEIMAMRKSIKKILSKPTGLVGGGGGTTGGQPGESGGKVIPSVPTGYGGSSNYYAIISIRMSLNRTPSAPTGLAGSGGAMISEDTLMHCGDPVGADGDKREFATFDAGM
jgi:hypothetical protein